MIRKLFMYLRNKNIYSRKRTFMETEDRTKIGTDKFFFYGTGWEPNLHEEIFVDIYNKTCYIYVITVVGHSPPYETQHMYNSYVFIDVITNEVELKARWCHIYRV